MDDNIDQQKAYFRSITNPAACQFNRVGWAEVISCWELLTLETDSGCNNYTQPLKQDVSGARRDEVSKPLCVLSTNWPNQGENNGVKYIEHTMQNSGPGVNGSF